MDNNQNMDDLIKKAQEMIRNNQIPEEIKDIVSSIKSSQVDNSSNLNTNSNPNKTTSNIDIQKFSSLVSKLNDSSDDNMSRLLFALKPYLRNQKQDKLDDYVKLVKMGKMAQFLDFLGGDKK